VFDLIGRHKYDHTLVEELSSYCDPSVDFPWYEPPFAELLANKLAGSGAMRQMAVLGVVTHHLYRTFLPPVELSKAWRYLGRRVVDLTANQHKVATAVIVMYKSVLEFLHPSMMGMGGLLGWWLPSYYGEGVMTAPSSTVRTRFYRSKNSLICS